MFLKPDFAVPEARFLLVLGAPCDLLVILCSGQSKGDLYSFSTCWQMVGGDF